MTARRVARWVLILVGAYLLVTMLAMMAGGGGFGPDLRGAVALGLLAWIAGWLLDRREAAEGSR